MDPIPLQLDAPGSTSKLQGTHIDTAAQGRPSSICSTSGVEPRRHQTPRRWDSAFGRLDRQPPQGPHSRVLHAAHSPGEDAPKACEAGNAENRNCVMEELEQRKEFFMEECKADTMEEGQRQNWWIREAALPVEELCLGHAKRQTVVLRLQHRWL